MTPSFRMCAQSANPGRHRRGLLPGLLVCLLSAGGVMFAVPAQAQNRLQPIANGLASPAPGDQLLALEQVAEVGPSAASLVPAIVALLQSPDPLIRHEAVIALSAIGPEARAAVPQLVPLLSGTDLILKYEALQTLRAIRPAGETVGSAIARLLTDADRMVQVEAAATILSLELPQREQAIRTLVEALKDGRVAVRAAAVSWLGTAGADALPGLQELAKSGGTATQAAAVDAIGLIGPEAESLAPTLRGLLTSPSGIVLASASTALASIGAGGAESVQALLPLSRHEQPGVRIAALRALSRLGAGDAGVVDALQKALADRELTVRLAACDGLADLGPHARAAIGGLVSALQQGEGAVTIRAAEALGQIGAPSLEPLLKLLDDERYAGLALETLMSMGPVAKPATENLLQRLKEPGLIPQRPLCLTLAAIGADVRTAGPVLKQVLNDPRSEARPAAAYALGRLGDASAVKDLTNVVEADDPMLRLASAWALLHLDPRNADYIELALPRLVEALQHPDPRVRLEVIRTLAQLGTKAAQAKPLLIAAVGHDESQPVRISAAMALAEIGPGDDATISALTALADHADAGGRRAAMFALGRLGSSAAAAVPVLERVVTTGSPDERLVAAWSLLEIQPDDTRLDLAVPVMLNALPQERAEIVVALVRSLSQHAGQRTAVRPAIERLLQSEDPALRAAAAAGLERLSGAAQ